MCPFVYPTLSRVHTLPNFSKWSVWISLFPHRSPSPMHTLFYTTLPQNHFEPFFYSTLLWKSRGMCTHCHLPKPWKPPRQNLSFVRIVKSSLQPHYSLSCHQERQSFWKPYRLEARHVQATFLLQIHDKKLQVPLSPS